jgi:hypothetical protein
VVNKSKLSKIPSVVTHIHVTLWRPQLRKCLHSPVTSYMLCFCIYNKLLLSWGLCRSCNPASPPHCPLTSHTHSANRVANITSVCFRDGTSWTINNVSGGKTGLTAAYTRKICRLSEADASENPVIWLTWPAANLLSCMNKVNRCKQNKTTWHSFQCWNEFRNSTSRVAAHSPLALTCCVLTTFKSECFTF